MKNIFKYTGLLALGFVSLTACQDDVDAPVTTVPVATLQANTTIAEVKAAYWSDDRNYIWHDPESADPISPIPMKENGEHIIIKGRVVSSDASGNIYKSLVIQDETAALAMSINANSMYNQYRRGQEILVDLTDMWIGKYNGLQQLGFPNFTEQYGWEATFMPFEFFKEHIQLNGMPEPDAINVINITGADLQSSTPENLRRLQSQFVRINDCEFEGGGTLTFTEGSKVTTNRNLTLADGTTLIVRTSGYSNFWGHTLPAGRGDVMGILSYYGTAWQLLLNSDRDCINFGNPTKNPGSLELPYTVGQAIEVVNAGTAANDVWATGFIVGAVKGGISEITSNDALEFTKDVSMDNTLVIAATPDVKDYAQCLIVQLPQGSALRTYGNLLDHPENYCKEITLMGNLSKVLGLPGVVTTGASDSFTIEGVTVPGGDTPGAVGAAQLTADFESGALPAGWTETVTSGNRNWQVKSFNNNYYVQCSAYKGTAGANGFQSWLITAAVDFDKMTEKVMSFETEIQYGTQQGNLQLYVLDSADPSKAQKTELSFTMPTPSSESSTGYVSSGEINLSQFTGVKYVAWLYTATDPNNSRTYRVDNVYIGLKPGDTPVDPTPTPGGDALDVTSADFNTLNGGTAAASPYGTYSTAQGWTATNSLPISGGSENKNPNFLFISSDPSVMAACLNGKAGSCGVLTSPLIANNLGSLSFKYGLPYSDTKISLLVEILNESGEVVRSVAVENLSATKLEAYTFDDDFDVEGKFQLRITNQGPSQASTNKDRVAIWDISWTR